jgi:hypothetical protein
MMYPLYLSITKSSSPTSHISLHYSSELSSYALITLSVLALISHSHPHQRVINIHLYLSSLLSSIASPSIPSPSVSPQHYSVYSIAPSSLVSCNYRSLYVIVVDSKSCWLYILSSLSLQTLLHLLHFILQPL